MVSILEGFWGGLEFMIINESVVNGISG